MNWTDPPRHPLSVHTLPEVVALHHKIQDKTTHGVRVQARHTQFQHWEHPPAVIGDHHLVGELSEVQPYLTFLG